MKVQSLVIQGMCSAILLAASVAPVWAEAVSNATTPSEPVVAAANNATEPVTIEGEEVVQTMVDQSAEAAVSNGAAAEEPVKMEVRPSSLSERRAVRRQIEANSVSEPADYTARCVEENLENPTIGVPTEGQVYQELSADLNHDQHIERVTLIPFATNEYGETFMRLTVFNDKNEIIYQTPRLTDYENVKTWALTNAGDYSLQLLYDLDGDGKIELLAGKPRSDVRPKPYRLWRWDGDKFVYLKDFTFQASERDRELFTLQEKHWDGVENVAWLENIAVRGGELKADVAAWKSYGMAQGKVVLEPNGTRGLKVVRWEKHIMDMRY